MPVPELLELFGGDVQDVMSEDVQRVKETAPIVQVAMVMAKQQLPRVFVIDQQGAFLGVVTQHDVVRYFLRAQEANAGDTSEEPVVVQSLLTREGRLSVSPKTPLVKAVAALVLARVRTVCRSSTTTSSCWARSP